MFVLQERMLSATRCRVDCHRILRELYLAVGEILGLIAAERPSYSRIVTENAADVLRAFVCITYSLNSSFRFLYALTFLCFPFVVFFFFFFFPGGLRDGCRRKERPPVWRPKTGKRLIRWLCWLVSFRFG